MEILMGIPEIRRTSYFTETRVLCTQFRFEFDKVDATLGPPSS